LHCFLSVFGFLSSIDDRLYIFMNTFNVWTRALQ
jgi:hypothetical protein